MREFLKLTRAKIILTLILSILLILLHLVFSIVIAMFGLVTPSLHPPCRINDASSIDYPADLYKAWQIAQSHCGSESRSLIVQFISAFTNIGIVLILLFVVYLAACALVAMYGRLKKKKKLYGLEGPGAV